MCISKETKKVEAIKRMQMLGLHKPCITAFKNRDEVWLSEYTGGLYEFSDNAELVEKVREFEEEYNALVYHVIHSPTGFGDLYNFLYVSNYEEEWEMDNANITDGYAMAYVWNKTVDWCSEFGTIAVTERFGGIVRVG